MRHIAISDYKKVKRIKIKGFGPRLHHVENFSTYRDSGIFDPTPFIKRITVIKEKAFIIDLIGYAHFHFVYDKIAQYEFIKKYDPEVKLYIVTTNKYLNEDNGILEDLKKIYLLPTSNIINIESGEKYIFKNLFFFWSTHNDLFQEVFLKEYFDPWSNKKDYKFYIKAIYPLLQDRFKDYIKPCTNKNTKIFISRFDQHEKFGRNKDDFRYISKDDEIKLENFFKDRGYQIYTAETLGFLEQVGLYSEAYRIAGIKASGLVNTIFCKKPSKVIAINLDDEYQVWYDYICKFIKIDYEEFPPILNKDGNFASYSVYRETHNRTLFSFEEIEKFLIENEAIL
jgi:hypothetical protein